MFNTLSFYLIKVVNVKKKPPKGAKARPNKLLDTC